MGIFARFWQDPKVITAPQSYDLLAFIDPAIFLDTVAAICSYANQRVAIFFYRLLASHLGLNRRLNECRRTLLLQCSTGPSFGFVRGEVSLVVRNHPC